MARERYRSSGALAHALVLVLVSLPTPADCLQDEDRRSSEPVEDIGRLLATRNARDFDSALPDLPFEDWLHGVLPVGTMLVYEVSDCGEQSGDPSIDTASATPECLSVYADVVSRLRQMELLFFKDAVVYRSGAVFSEELEGTVRIERLSGLDSALKKPLRPYPLVCPEDTTLKLKEEYAGLYEWCEDDQGRNQGPYRSWFSTGLYLMQVGTYESGAKTGAWIECSRFETCERKDYTGMGN